MKKFTSILNLKVCYSTTNCRVGITLPGYIASGLDFAGSEYSLCKLAV